MRTVKILIAVWLACGLTSVASAQISKTKDPSGTWRWDYDANGDTIKNVLKLNADKDGKVTGTLEARDMTMEVKQGKVQDGKLSFQITVELEQSIEIDFDGKLDGDKIKGQAKLQANGEAREMEWEAKRSVEASDVVGAWDLKIETPDGVTLTPVITLTQTGKELTGKYENAGTQVDAKELKIKDNHVLFSIDTEFQGSPLHVDFKARPYGNKLSGELEYSVNGDSGELTFSGVRKADKKS